MRKSILEMPSHPSSANTVVAYFCARLRMSAGRSCGSRMRSAPAIPSVEPTVFGPSRRYFSANVSGVAWLVAGISVTDATGSSRPATATLISSRFLMNGSMIASTSYSKTRRRPAMSSSALVATDTPALDPRLHGFTMTGQPNEPATRAGYSVSHSGPRSSTDRSHDSHCTTGTPAWAAMIFVTRLFMPMADAMTPHPT